MKIKITVVLIFFLLFVSLFFMYNHFNIAGVYTGGKIYYFETTKEKLISTLIELKKEKKFGIINHKCYSSNFNDEYRHGNYYIYFMYPVESDTLIHSCIVREKWNGNVALIYESVLDDECYSKLIDFDFSKNINENLINTFEDSIVKKIGGHLSL